jgi:hypothetical protein
MVLLVSEGLSGQGLSWAEFRGRPRPGIGYSAIAQAVQMVCLSGVKPRQAPQVQLQFVGGRPLERLKRCGSVPGVPVASTNGYKFVDLRSVYHLSFRYGLVARISRSHREGPGSIPGVGTFLPQVL